jgi:hypothetical protein
MQSSQHKEPLIQTEIPPGPWHAIGTELFYLDGAEYLLVADYYSKYLIVREVPEEQQYDNREFNERYFQRTRNTQNRKIR